MMQLTLLALMPGTAVYTFIFGLGVLVNIIGVCAAAIVTEALFLKLREEPLTHLMDGTSLVAAWLMALCLPPLLPIWQAATGICLGLIFGKHVYGGLGRNIFNPAMVGFAILIVSFPLTMSKWPEPRAQQHVSEVLRVKFQVNNSEEVYDGLTAATPLDDYKFRSGITNKEFFSAEAEHNWRYWSLINVAFLVGGIFLIYRGITSWHAPLGFLISLIILAGVFYDNGSSHSLGSPVFHLFSGATMLAAFFIITDPVTSPASKELLAVYGALIGSITFLIRTVGAYPEGVAFAVLLSNACAPLIDHLAAIRKDSK